MTQQLATFKIDGDKWKAFQELAKSENTSASAMLKDLIDWILAGNRISQEGIPDIDERIEKKLASLKKEILEELRGELLA